jgi:hypothetical protein
VERHHKFTNVITATVMARIWLKLARIASRLDVSNGSTPAVGNRHFDLESWSEPPRIPAMPSVDRANGASCQELPLARAEKVGAGEQ